MPRRFTMTDARLRCQEQCDLVNDLHISPAEWYRYMSRAYGELYSIVSSTGMRYFETVYSITTTGAVSYQEPTSHFETVSMCEVVDTVAGRRRNLREAMEQERSSLMGQTGPAAFYALIDDQLFLYPTPPAGATYEMCYVPQPPDLNTYGDTDIIDVVTPDGEAFFTWGVAVMALAKSESSTDLALQEREAARKRFTESVIMRGLNTPRRREFEDDSRSNWNRYYGPGWDDY